MALKKFRKRAKRLPENLNAQKFAIKKCECLKKGQKMVKAKKKFKESHVIFVKTVTSKSKIIRFNRNPL